MQTAPPDEREYVVSRLQNLGAGEAEAYARLLRATPVSRVIEGLSPWAFLPSPRELEPYCSEAAGRPLLPFAQAIGLDMVACFTLPASGGTGVLVIDPWHEGSCQTLATLPGFAAWLSYARDLAHRLAAG